MIRQIFIFFVLIFLIFPQKSFAASQYVLPYPAAMPGTLEHKIHALAEYILPLWYFGSLGRLSYDLKESDRYLVEAKTLFEYNQYLLGVDALAKSNQYFSQLKNDLNLAKKDNKDIQEKQKIVKQAAEKHIEVLTTIEQFAPLSFTWNPEKGAKTFLPLHDLINNSIIIRKKAL